MSDVKTMKRDFVTAAVIAFVLALVAPGVPLMAPVAGTAAAIMALNARRPYLPVAFFVFAGGVFFGGSLLFGSGLWFAVGLSLMCFVPAICLTLLFSLNIRLKTIILITASVFGAAICGAVCLYVFIKGGELSAEGASRAFVWLSDALEAAVKTVVDSAGDTKLAESYAELVEAFRVSVKDYYIPLFPSFCVCIGFIAAVPAALFVKNHPGKSDVSRVGYFSGFSTERILAVLMIVCYIVSLFSYNNTLGITLKNLSMIGIAYFAVGGLSFISFIMRLRGTKTVIRYIVYAAIAAVCVLTVGLDLLAVLGIIEGLLQLRGRFERVVKANGVSLDSSDLTEVMDKLKEKAERGESGEEKEDDTPWYERDEYKKHDGSDSSETDENGENKK